MEKKVSVIIPIYNAEKKLRDCVDSILKQDYKEIEVILVDDGSTDASLDICKEYESKDERIVVVHTENQGSGPARNAGIDAASGEWAYFPDADDLIEMNAITTMLQAAENNSCDLVVFGYQVIDPNGNLTLKKVYPNLVVEGEAVRKEYEKYYATKEALCIQGAPWNKFFKMDVIRRNAVRYPALKRHQDEAFICRYVGYVQRVCFIQDVLYTYYANDSSIVDQKYPVNYVDCVLGLYKIRKETILSWNPENKKVREILSDELICNTIWAFELSFHKKYQMNYRKRLRWMKEKIQAIDFSEIEWERIDKRPYRRIVARLLPKRTGIAYFMIHSKRVLGKLLLR